MTYDINEAPTYDHRLYETTGRLRGFSARGIYSGRRVSDGAQVLITRRHTGWTKEFLALVRWEVPGVSPLLYIGAPDGYRPPPYRVWESPGALIELRPSGITLDQIAGPMDQAGVVSLGSGLLSIVQSALRQRVEMRGIRPETVYVVEKPDGWTFGGLAPRSARILGHQIDGPYGTPFEPHSYEAPEEWYPDEMSPKADLFSWALVVWWAHTRRHPYRVTPNEPDDWTMSHDENRTEFPGPPEIGRILERVLVADPAKRPEIDEVQAEWNALETR